MLHEQGQFHYVLFDGEEPVVTAHVMWWRMQWFDAIMECGEGTYQAHIDLSRYNRQSVAFKVGQNYSLVGLVVTGESIAACSASIVTLSKRQLWLVPSMALSRVYSVTPPGGPTLFTLEACLNLDPGTMFIAPQAAGDPELPALVAMAFAMANEQSLLLHRGR
ncbi:MAG TPA: hypothetical protein VHQ03_04055 [Candidatus Dormibacteraeota bacterium]|nr:hypothetical protein [Candidatus Dormibacteraeota bacterium]